MNKLQLAEDIQHTNAYKASIIKHQSLIRRAWDAVKQPLLRKQIITQEEFDQLEHNITYHDKSKLDTQELQLSVKASFTTDPEEREKLKDMSYCLHQNANPHHFEFYMLFTKNEIKALPMPKIYIIEMLLDWYSGLYRYSEYPTLAAFYLNQERKMLLHKETTHILLDIILVIDELLTGF